MSKTNDNQMILSVGKVYTIKDLNTPSRKLKPSLRSNVSIVVIDDEEFQFLDELRSSGFNITHYPDIQDIRMLEAFPVIISDIRGVGKAFKSSSEGAFLLRELKKKYPLKVLAAYTGSAYDINLNSYLEGVHVIKKDIEIDEWCEEIDNLIRITGDPKEIWNKIRDILIREEVPLLSLAKLEHEYVDILLNKDGNFHGFPSSDKKLKLPSDVRGVIQSLVGGIILSWV
ncbi:MAG: hypothetical protein LBR68_07110 [Lachnoclostridium sp.]|nr:hypothetical protein [Lachnoclostridium sp.]